MKKSTYLFTACTALLLLTQCKHTAKVQTDNYTKPDSEKGLKDYYQNYFPIGVAVNVRAVQSADSTLILREFNSLTPENDIEMGPIHPAENRYNWGNADAIVAFAQRHNMRVRGHNLCWHNQARHGCLKMVIKQQVKNCFYEG